MIGGAIIGAMSNYPTGPWTANNSILQPLDVTMELALPLTSDANDIKNGRNFTNNGGVTFSSSGASFNATDQWLDNSATGMTGLNDWTISCWFNATTLDTVHGMYQKLTGTYTYPSLLTHNGNEVYEQVESSTNNPIVYSGGILSISTLYHLAVTCKDGGNLIMYINGSQIDSVANTCAATEYNDWTAFQIGRRLNAYWGGLVKAFYVWKNELTSTEIAALYNGGAGAFYTG